MEEWNITGAYMFLKVEVIKQFNSHTSKATKYFPNDCQNIVLEKYIFVNIAMIVIDLTPVVLCLDSVLTFECIGLYNNCILGGEKADLVDVPSVHGIDCSFYQIKY